MHAAVCFLLSAPGSMDPSPRSSGAVHRLTHVHSARVRIVREHSGDASASSREPLTDPTRPARRDHRVMIHKITPRDFHR